MRIGNWEDGQETLIVAEIGNNHEGDFNLAKLMAEKASEAGADVVKFQTIVPEKLVQSSDKNRIEQLGKFQFSIEQFIELKKHCDSLGVMFMTTAFDPESAVELDVHVPAFKVASGDNNYWDLINTLIELDKPMIISTGMADEAEVDKLVDHLNSKGAANVALLHCVSTYPVDPDCANLSSIKYFQDKYDLVIGYSDHLIGTQGCIAACAMGASIIEKHFTIDNNYSDFRDHALSANPTDFADMVNQIRQIEQLKGSYGKPIQGDEIDMRLAARRSMASKTAIKKDKELSMEDITWLRPGSGLQVDDLSKVIGKQALRDINSGELLKTEDFK